MRLRANPNRMELLRLRRRLVLAERGHKLLKDKLDELMRSFLATMKELSLIKEELDKDMEKIWRVSALLRTQHFPEEINKLAGEREISIACRQERILNLIVPVLESRDMDQPFIEPWRSEAELEVGKKALNLAWPRLLKMAELWRRAELLADEIETTRRRVNALEHILIPSIKETIRYIASRLDEIERSYKTQLMRLKEIIERH